MEICAEIIMTTILHNVYEPFLKLLSKYTFYIVSCQREYYFVHNNTSYHKCTVSDEGIAGRFTDLFNKHVFNSSSVLQTTMLSNYVISTDHM